jgi:hypothetical protein
VYSRKMAVFNSLLPLYSGENAVFQTLHMQIQVYSSQCFPVFLYLQHSYSFEIVAHMGDGRWTWSREVLPQENLETERCLLSHLNITSLNCGKIG